VSQAVAPVTDSNHVVPAKTSLVDLQTEVVAAREELMANLTELQAALTPGALAKRGLGSVTGWFTDEFGGVRPERVAIVGAAVVGYVAIRLLTRRR
jgi:hypothetical protein